jgi:hypothetical protein
MYFSYSFHKGLKIKKLSQFISLLFFRKLTSSVFLTKEMLVELISTSLIPSVINLAHYTRAIIILYQVLLKLVSQIILVLISPFFQALLDKLFVSH